MQGELNFEAGDPQSGLARWRAEQRRWQAEFARNNGLPLNKRCRVVLKNDMELVGMLLVADNQLPLDASRKPDLELQIDRCIFKASEIASVARMD